MQTSMTPGRRPNNSSCDAHAADRALALAAEHAMPLFTGRARSLTTEGLPATPVKQEPPPHQEEAAGGLKVEVEARDSASATPEQFGRRPRAATGYDRWRDMARDGEGPSFTQARDQLHGSSSFTGATRFNADGTVSPESQSQSFKSTARRRRAFVWWDGGRLSRVSTTIRLQSARRLRSSRAILHCRLSSRYVLWMACLSLNIPCNAILRGGAWW